MLKMFIKSFSIENFRSITKANELPLSNLSILIGPNNEGKSNLLRALNIALNYLKDRGYRSRTHNFLVRQRHYSEVGFNFERDYPLSLEKNDKSESVFKIEFDLTQKEKDMLSKIIRKSFTGNLKIGLFFGRTRNGVSIRDSNKPTSTSLFNCRNDIFEFIVDHLEVSYIQAIRDSDQTINIIEEMISKELSSLENDKRYSSLMKKLEKLQKPILDSLSNSLTKGVSEFLPVVKSIHLDSKERIKRISRLATSVHVDDGTNTPLELKGDGIKSLMAISIIQHLTKQHAAKKNILLAIEEPESHLHPDAIHKLRDVLRDISTTNQVIISTHSPLLVNRSEISRNLIVHKSQVSPAKNISDIRNILGVKIADNLQSANLVILVEGFEDKMIIKRCIEQMSTKIKKAIEQGIITFDVLDGSSNLSHKITMWNSSLCDVYAFLDNDLAGQQAFDVAQNNGLLTPKQAIFSYVNGFRESEIEDLVDTKTYASDIKKFGVDLLSTREFRGNRYKWSIRMKKAFQANSKRWNDKIEKEVKNIVANKVSEIGVNSINKHHQTPLKSLTKSLEEYLVVDSKSKI